jgi:RES domain
LRSLAGPPADLADFPVHRLLPSQRLFRVHLAKHGPWWFAATGDGRFDLALPRGTCYLADEAAGAFIEACQEPGVLIPADYLRHRRLSVLSVPRELHLADCTVSRARAFGITGEIHSSVARQRTQAWARAFAQTGFDGVRFLARHDPAQRQVGIALFGPAGEAAWPVLSTDDIAADLVLEVERRFGIRVQF